jgi:hypothetical protein
MVSNHRCRREFSMLITASGWALARWAAGAGIAATVFVAIIHQLMQVAVAG